MLFLKANENSKKKNEIGCTLKNEDGRKRASKYDVILIEMTHSEEQWREKKFEETWTGPQKCLE